METVDPRDQVTQTAFEIAPEVLGVELAAPWRRALALGIDLLLAATVTATGGSAAAGLVVAILFILVAMRTPSKSRPRRVGRAAVVSLVALILFGIATEFIGDAMDDDTSPWPSDDVAQVDPVEATESDLRALGVRPDSLTLARGWAEPDTTWTREERSEAARALRAYAETLASGDSTFADSLRPVAALWASGAEVVARDRETRVLEEEWRRVLDERDDLQDAAENPGYLKALLPLAADIGLPLGWIGFYFTLTLGWWGGYTPGKRLLGIRVMRLDGKRIGLWIAFERFGGYAAGIVTGLLGFAQILWDPNRQGVQDKIAGTAVVRMRDARTPRRAS